MSYSNINDAFNINSNFENMMRGFGTFNPVNNTIENIKSGYNSNLNSNKSQFETEYHQKNNLSNTNNNEQDNLYNSNSNFDNNQRHNSNKNISYSTYNNIFDSSNDNVSWESLNGTDLTSNKCNDILVSNSNSNSNSNSTLSNSNHQHKLTHRECINIYNNPDSQKDNILTQALKHISKCKLCKDEIKKSLLSEKENNKNIEKQNSYHNDNFTENESNFINNLFSNNKNYNRENNGINLDYKINRDKIPINNLHQEKIIANKLTNSNSQIESELKLLNDKINSESNLKYQNAMLQNNLSKYLEDLEEKKKINYKLDKIMELVNLNLSKTKNESQTNYDEYFKTNQNQNLLNQQLSPQLLSNLLKLTQNNQQQYNSNTQIGWDSYLLYFGICIIILLLIIDIIMRFGTRDH